MIPKNSLSPKIIGVLVLVFIGLNWMRMGSGIKDGDEITSQFYAKGTDINALYHLKESFTNIELNETNNSPKGVTTAILNGRGGDGMLYHMSLHLWMQLFGDSDSATRFLSLLAMALALILVMLLAYEIFEDGRVAFVAGIIFTLHPLIADYSLETRPYAMGVCLTLLATYFFVRLFKTEQTKLSWLALAYGITATMAFFTTYLTAYVLIAHAALAILALRDKRKWLHLVLSGVIVIVFVGGWFYAGALEALSNLSGKSDWWKEFVQKTTRYAYPATPGGLAKGLIRYLDQIFGNNLFGKLPSEKMFLVFSLGFLPISGFLALKGLLNREATKEKALKYWLPIILLIVPVAIALYSAYKAGHTVSMSRRYGTFIVPYISILFGAIIINFRNEVGSMLSYIYRVSVIVWAIVFLGSAFMSIPTNRGSNFYSNHIENHYPEVAKEVLDNYQVGDTLVFGNAEDAMRLNTYLDTDIEIYQRVDVNQKVDLIYLASASNPDTLAEFYDFKKFPDRAEFRYFWPY